MENKLIVITQIADEYLNHQIFMYNPQPDSKY